MEGSCIGYDACYAVARGSNVVGDVTNSCGDEARAGKYATAYSGSLYDVSSSCLTF